MPLEPFLGEISLVAFNFAPRGYAFCQGQILPIAQNTALFSLLGTTYGGNGQTTFALPDLRGRLPVGVGPGPGLSPVDLGQVGGSETVTLTQNQLPAHSHGAASTQATGTSTRPSNQFPAAGQAVYAAASDGTTLNAGFIKNTGGGQPVGVKDPFLGLNYIIAIEGIFPSRN
jgi:microcystin-dependent protein